MNSLLEQADGLLSEQGSGLPERARAACWLARAALEDIVEEFLAHKGHPAPEARMAHRLSCLAVLYEKDDPELASQAEYLWWSLSQASHQHAYELAPTPTEVRHLLNRVADFAARVPG